MQMSSTKRIHTTEIGSITCPELTQLGAGTESWLVQDPNLLTSLHNHTLALSNRHLILLINFHQTHAFTIKPLFPDSKEHITALSFLSFDDVTSIVIGTSRGYIMLYSLSGELVHRQLVYPSRILRLRVREGERSEMASYGEMMVSLEGIVARFSGGGLRELVKGWVEERKEGFWGERKEWESGRRVEYELWNVNKFGNCVDAVITGVMPPPLMEFKSNQRYYCAVTIGEDAVISAYRLSEDSSRSLVGAILSKVVPATFSTIASFSKMIWRSDQNSKKKTEPKPQSFAKASPLTCLKDHPRKGEKLTLSPSGTLAAITDSLGRILLLDTQALVVVRLWKGYRDASCLFMEMLANKDNARASSSYYEPSKSDYFLCLAIHAPRKGIIEIWQMRTGPRLLTIQCAKGSIMLQPTYRFDSPYVPLEVFLLNGDSGQLSVLNRSIN